MEQGPHNYASFLLSSTDDLPAVAEAMGTDWVFRGHEECRWDLSSTLERTPLLPEERAEFEAMTLQQAKLERLFLEMEEVHQYDHFSWLALLQHHGCSTRLLDFSECFYVALYFAVRHRPDTDSAVWAISTRALSARLKELADSTDGALTPANVAQRLVNNSVDAPDRYKGDSRLAIAYGKPAHINRRMRAQQGVFLCSLTLDRSFKENLTEGVGLTGKKEHVPRLSTLAELAAEGETGKAIKVCIPASARVQFLSHLRKMNITEATLFPGVDGFARSLNDFAVGVEWP